MNPKYEIHEWIDRYLNGEMSEADALEFESRLSTDANLLETLEAQKAANKIVMGRELLNLKRQMALDLNGSNPGSISGKPWKFFISGTLIVTTAIIIYLFNSENPHIVKEEVNKQETLQDNSTIISEDILENNDSACIDEQNLIKPEDVKINNKKVIVAENTQKEEVLSDSIINFSCQARGTCIQTNDGAIEIDINTIKTGQGPFLFSLMPDSNFNSKPIISELKAGKYNLYVKDSKQRVRKLQGKVEVPVINCSHLIK
jgi:hypothetical protein